jgi:site-specific DNA-methyltransferase (adenine-specific)
MPDRIGEFALDEIYHGDAIDLMAGLPAESLDLIVTDPPFAIDFRPQRGNYNRDGDRVLAGYREIPRSEYLSFTRKWMHQASRILRSTGSMYVFSGWNQLKDILIALDTTGFTTINHLIWKYQFGVFTRRRFVTSHYHILFVAKDPKQYHFNKVEHYPEDVWVINREYWKGRTKTPTKLPIELVKKIIRYSSEPGEIVFDPFAGSGTVPVVAKMLGRQFLGFEIVDEYVALARERLAGIRDPGTAAPVAMDMA